MKSTERLERITRSILVEGAPLHVMTIADTADEHPVAVDLACARLHERGEIYPVGRGYYDIDRRRNLPDGDTEEESRGEESPPPGQR